MKCEKEISISQEETNSERKFLDRMHPELGERWDEYENFFEKFSVLAEFVKLNKHGLLEKAEKLQSFYPDDLEVTFG